MNHNNLSKKLGLYLGKLPIDKLYWSILTGTTTTNCEVRIEWWCENGKYHRLSSFYNWTELNNKNIGLAVYNNFLPLVNEYLRIKEYKKDFEELVN